MGSPPKPRGTTFASWALLAVLWLQGCAVGVAGVDAPETPPAQAPPRFADTAVYFTVCRPDAPSEDLASGIVEAWQDTVWLVLVEDYGLRVHEGEPPAGEPYVHFLLRPLPADSPPGVQTVSALVSLLTLSMIPGYFTEPHRVEALVAMHEPPAAPVSAEFRYEYRIRYFVWLPLIVYPDFLLGLNGGSLPREEERRAREQVTRRLVHDADHAPLAAIPQKTGAVPENAAACPSP